MTEPNPKEFVYDEAFMPGPTEIAEVLSSFLLMSPSGINKFMAIKSTKQRVLPDIKKKRKKRRKVLEHTHTSTLVRGMIRKEHQN